MTDKEKQELIDEVIKEFDFVKAHMIDARIHKNEPNIRSIGKMKETARKQLQKALEHQDREFWWMGGMHRGGLCACYDNNWGLSLNYIAVASRKRIFKTKKL